MKAQEQILINWIDEHTDDLIQTAKDLISFKTISSAPDANERYDKINEYIASVFRKMGLEGKVVRRGENGSPNFVVVMKGTGGGKNLGMGGHTDVVPADEPDWITGSGYEAKVIDGKLYGRGAADMKGGLAACITAIKALYETGVKLAGDVVFVASCDEEVGGFNGMVYVVESGSVNVDYFINAEQTNMKAMTGYKGNCWLKVTVKGSPAHGSTPHLGINAIEKASEVIDIIKKTGFTWEEHPFMGKSTITIGTISGGTAKNVVPWECSFTMDVRMIEGQTHESIIEEMRALFKKMMREDKDLNISVDFESEGTIWSVEILSPTFNTTFPWISADSFSPRGTGLILGPI